MFQNQMNPMGNYQIGVPQFSSGINFVNGVQEVEKFDLPPGGTAVFFDKGDENIMYIRSRDVYNIYKTRIYSFTEIQPKLPETPYVTRAELEEMFQRFLGGVNNVTVQPNNGATATAANATDTAAAESSSSRKRKTDGSDIGIIK